MIIAAPLGLALLASLPLIVLAHLRRLWHRRVSVSSLEPWRTLVGLAPHRRRSLPRTVLLALHLLAATLIGVAAADPRIAGPGGTGAVAVVLDATTSMGMADRWPAARQAARDALGSATDVTLVVARNASELVAARAPAAEALTALASLEPGGAPGDLTPAVELARAVAGPGAPVTLITDRMVAPEVRRMVAPEVRRMVAPEVRQATGLIAWRQVGTTSPASNAAVTVAGLDGHRLYGRIEAFGEPSAPRSLTLLADGRAVETRTVAPQPGQPVEVTWTAPASAESVGLRLAPPDAFPVDDVAILSAERWAARVQLVGDSAATERAVEAMPFVRVRRSGRATFLADGSADVTVFAGFVPARLPLGGTVLVAPPPGAEVASGELRIGLTGRAAGDVAMLESPDRPLGLGISLGTVTVHRTAEPRAEAGLEVFMTAGGRPAATAGEVGDRRLVVLAFDPDAPDASIARRPAFPQLVARSVLWAAGPALPAAVSAGERVWLPPGAAAVEGPGPVTESSGWVGPLARPGLYRMSRPGGSASAFGVVAGDPIESDPSPQAVRDLPEPGPLAGGRERLTRGLGDASSLAPALAVFAVVVLVAEGALRARGIA